MNKTEAGQTLARIAAIKLTAEQRKERARKAQAAYRAKYGKDSMKLVRRGKKFSTSDAIDG